MWDIWVWGCCLSSLLEDNQHSWTPLTPCFQTPIKGGGEKRLGSLKSLISYRISLFSLHLPFKDLWNTLAEFNQNITKHLTCFKEKGPMGRGETDKEEFGSLQMKSRGPSGNQIPVLLSWDCLFLTRKVWFIHRVLLTVLCWAECPPLLPPHFYFASSSLHSKYPGRFMGEYYCNTLLLLIYSSSLFWDLSGDLKSPWL